MKFNSIKKIIAFSLLVCVSLSGCGNTADKQQTQSPNAIEDYETKEQMTADSKASGTGEKTKLNVVTAGGGFWEPAMAKIEEDYETTHPDIDLNIEIYGYEQFLQVIEVKVASGGSNYDVLTVDAPLVAAYTERGYIKPLDNYISKDEQNMFIDSSLKSSIWNGNFMASPMQTSAMLLFYNKTILNEAGVKYESNMEYGRTTWESLVDMSNKVLDKVDPERNQGYVGIGMEQMSRPYTILPLVNTIGEVGLSDDGFTVEGVINTEGWIKAMTFYYDLFENKTSLRGIKGEGFSPLFLSGKTVFHIGGPWNYYSAMDAQDFEVGVAAFPTFEGYEGKTATPTGSYHLGISSHSKNEAAAAEFIRYMTLGEGNKIWIEERQDVPALKASLDDMLANKDTEEIYQMCAFDAANTGYARPITPGYSEWESVMTTTFEDIRNGSDPKQALDGAVQQINQLFKKYKD